MKGCERIRIKALIPKNAGVSDCTAAAYPRFAERATVDVPMPRKLVGAQLVSGSGSPTPGPQSPPPPGRGSPGDARPVLRGRAAPREVTRWHAWPLTPGHHTGPAVLQKTKDHFLEVKMESSRQRFFHLLNDFAYIEVSDSRPSRERVSSLTIVLSQMTTSWWLQNNRT